MFKQHFYLPWIPCMKFLITKFENFNTENESSGDFYIENLARLI